MLFSFRIKNFKSIVDTTVDLSASDGAVSCLGLYGINASGKSNIIEALSVLKDIVAKGYIGYRYFPNKIHKAAYSYFELSFEAEQRVYTYLLYYDNSSILCEALNCDGVDLYQIISDSHYFSAIASESYPIEKLEAIFRAECVYDLQRVAFLHTLGQHCINAEVTIAFNYFAENIINFRENSPRDWSMFGQFWCWRDRAKWQNAGWHDREAPFVFDDIKLLSDWNIQEILKAVKNKTLVLALKAASKSVKNKLFENMSKRAVAYIIEEMEFMGPVRLADAEKAQQEIVVIAIELKDCGVISFNFKDDIPYELRMQKAAATDRKLQDIIRIINKLDIGINGMRGESGTIYTYHADEGPFVFDEIAAPNGSGVRFRLDEESLGTQLMVRLLAVTFDALEAGSTVLIDELDASLHSLLLREIIELFKDKGYNAKGAQLIFSANNATILAEDGLIHAAELGIVSKTQAKGTIFARATDYGITSDQNLWEAYRSGKFGRIF